MKTRSMFPLALGLLFVSMAPATHAMDKPTCQLPHVKANAAALKSIRMRKAAPKQLTSVKQKSGSIPGTTAR